MLQPQQAAKRLTRHHAQGLDDPTEPSRPIRWYWNAEGQLCRTHWRATCPETFPIWRQEEQQRA